MYFTISDIILSNKRMIYKKIKKKKSDIFTSVCLAKELKVRVQTLALVDRKRREKFSLGSILTATL